MIDNIGENDRKSLEKLLCDDEFIRLEEDYGSQFNIFNAIGMNVQEIKHSNFLAWLFNPKESHMLKDYFVKNFLKAVLKEHSSELPTESLTVFDIDGFDMTNTIVKRENCNIDILLIDTNNNFACVIENKIKAKQSNFQLKKYKEKIFKYYPNIKHFIFLYLKPVDDEELEPPYLYASYRIIRELLLKVQESKKTYLSNDILMVLQHYTDLLEREVMGSDEALERLCQQIYDKHKDALKLIYDNVDMVPAQAKIAEVLVPILESYHYKRIKGNGSRNIKFLPENVSSTNLDFYFKIWNTGGAGDKYELKVELVPENNFDKQKLEKIRQAVGITSGKKIGTIMGKNDLMNICEAIEEGCFNNEEQSKLEGGFKKILEKIKREDIEQILNNN